MNDPTQTDIIEDTIFANKLISDEKDKKTNMLNAGFTHLYKMYRLYLASEFKEWVSFSNKICE